MVSVATALLLSACGSGKTLPDLSYDLPAAERPAPPPETQTSVLPGAVDAAGETSAASVAAPEAGAPEVDTLPAACARVVAPGITVADVVGRAYELAYGRAPERYELVLHALEIDQGKPRITLLHELVRAPELETTTVGLTNAQFVVVVIQRFLHRAPTGDEVSSGTFALSRHFASRPQYADSLVGAAEFALASNPEHAYFF